LGQGVGYIRLKQFQSTSSEELDAALEQLHRAEKMRALVLDLRGNPGGLLDQAAKVADKFLEAGTIVATVGVSEGRDEKRAVKRGTEPSYPIVVLTSGSSASASEIVAGALKNLDRAVIVGQTTFGKGSVQLVFPRITPDGAALKLTIAQYLTPGDVSIQGVGVAPDIELDAMTADTLEMDLFRSENQFRERDLSKSLTGGAKRSTDTAFFTLRYNLPEKERAEIRERGGDLDDEFRVDFGIGFARDLAAKLTTGKRPDVLRAAKPFLEKVQEREMQAVAADLAKLGFDWNAPPAEFKPLAKAGDYEVKVETDRKDDAALAGEPMTLKVTVKNKAQAPIFRLRGVTKSDGGYYDEKELIFGRINPGESKTSSVPLGWCEVEGRKVGSTKPLPLDAKRLCKLPMDADTRQDVVRVRFFAEGGEAPADGTFTPTVKSLPRPIFAYTYHVVDNRPGNGDGQLARGEGATIYMTVKNVGKGRSYETQGNLRNLTGDGLLLHGGRFDISNLDPGAVRQVAFTFDVLDALTENFAKVEMSVVDRDLRVVSSEKVTIPITKSGLNIASTGGRMTALETAGVRGQPVSAAPFVGQLTKGAVVDRLGSYGDFTKVALGPDRFGFVESRQLRAGGAAVKLDYQPLLTHSPPLLEVQPGQLATRDSKVHIEGIATDGDRVLDAFIFVGSRKVFYQSNRKSTDPKRLKFSLDAELNPGINVISVVTRESEDTATRQTMVVRRDGPNGEPLPTPKDDLFGDGWEFEGGGDE
jgi:carboxyl-terminal processing protease